MVLRQSDQFSSTATRHQPFIEFKTTIPTFKAQAQIDPARAPAPEHPASNFEQEERSISPKEGAKARTSTAAAIVVAGILVMITPVAMASLEATIEPPEEEDESTSADPTRAISEAAIW